MLSFVLIRWMACPRMLMRYLPEPGDAETVTGRPLVSIGTEFVVINSSMTPLFIRS